MESDGENILQLVKQMRTLCGQISLLLRTSDKLMRKGGWDKDSNYVLATMSYSVETPSQWIPFYFFRFYRNEVCLNRLAFVSVLIADHYDGDYTIKEPLLTGGFFDYGKKNVTDDNWDNWLAQYYGRLAQEYNLQPNGEPFSFETLKLPKTIRGKFEKGKVFAAPLTSFTNEKDVELKITNKLLTLLGES